jgi:hypothetical protein
MQKHITQVMAWSLLALLFVGTNLHAQEQTAPAQPNPEASPEEIQKQPRPYPFRGRLFKVDLEAKTITLKGKTSTRVFHITPKTRLVKHGKKATLKDAKPGEEVGGLVRKTPEGKRQAVMVRFGPKPGSENAGPTEPTEPTSSAAEVGVEADEDEPEAEAEVESK